ncbi:hypothetical protein [Burkholderia vietnamiensis]|nr:hypothetical protein [Burkholderia vietnamiensis]
MTNGTPNARALEQFAGNFRDNRKYSGTTAMARPIDHDGAR